MAENGFLSLGHVSYKRFEYQGLVGRIRVEPHYGLGVRVSCRVDLDNGPGGQHVVTGFIDRSTLQAV